MRKIQKAAQQAGANADPEEVAKHYVAPVLARYIFGTDSTFLGKLTQKAQPIAEELLFLGNFPTDEERLIPQRAFKRILIMERVWGWFGVSMMGVLFVILFSYTEVKMPLLGFLMPFIGPGFPAYLLASEIGIGISKCSKEYKNSIMIAARIIAAERVKLDYWKNLHWRELEQSVAALFRRKGYRAFATPASGDKGVDVVAESSGEKIVIQCKQYSKPAQRNLVSELLGVLVAEGADHAILICTGGFTKEAEEYARHNQIILWDLNDLVSEHEMIRTYPKTSLISRIEQVR